MKISTFSCIYVVISCLITVSTCGKVINLPGYNGPELNQFTGYITLNEETGKSYFYWLIESQNNLVTDPLIVWYQGGPGCSGLLGLFTENGPFRPDGMGGIMYNDISWSAIANVLYIEQPCGVGFSYSNSSADYYSNDTSAANDNYLFLENWLQAFPQFQGRRTFLSGESYAGVYIPTAVNAILSHPDSIIANQLAGFTIGNPVISCVSADYNAIQMDLFYYHALVSNLVYSNWTSWGCDANSSQGVCNDIFDTALSQIGVIYQQKRDVSGFHVEVEPSLDPDDLYQDFCTGNGTLDFAVNLGYPNACLPVGNQLITYLNRKDVQNAIGAMPTVWNFCGGNNFHYDAFGNSMIPYYEFFFEGHPDLEILIYSGDVDVYTVPFGYTMACLAELEETATPVTPWQPWFVNGATAGYVEQYNHYSYATLKGAGHEAPAYQPLTSYELFSRFILNQDMIQSPKKLKTSPRITQARVLKEYGIKG